LVNDQPKGILVGMALRRAKLSDLPALLPLMVAFNRHEAIAWTPESGTAALQRLLSDESLGTVGLAEDAGQTIGYVVLTWGFDLEWNGRDAFLTELFVAETYRGGGVGKALLAYAEQTARQMRAGALHLMVRPDNLEALKLYAASGFEDPGRKVLTKRLQG
jgi:ribosomal protein S18 acetylase RimI-like enzyme